MSRSITFILVISTFDKVALILFTKFTHQLFTIFNLFAILWFYLHINYSQNYLHINCSQNSKICYSTYKCIELVTRIPKSIYLVFYDFPTIYYVFLKFKTYLKKEKRKIIYTAGIRHHPPVKTIFTGGAPSGPPVKTVFTGGAPSGHRL